MREKSALFNKWCNASNVNTSESLRELVLLEEFSPRKSRISLCAAAILAALTHKDVFCPQSRCDLVPEKNSNLVKIRSEETNN